MKKGISMVMRRSGMQFLPVDPVSEEMIMSVPQGKEVVVTVTQPRNPRFNSMVHALLKIVVDNHPEFKTIDGLKAQLKYHTGMFELFIGPNGREFVVLDRTDFATMDQLEFREVWKNWKTAIELHVLPGIDSAAMQHEILSQL